MIGSILRPSITYEEKKKKKKRKLRTLNEELGIKILAGCSKEAEA